MTTLKGHSFSPDFIQLVKINYLSWLVYFILYNCYSLFWRGYATETDYSYVDSLAWFSKEWGIWLIISPTIIWLLERLQLRYSLPVALLSAGIICLTFTCLVRIQLNFGEYPPSWIATTIIMLPKYLPAYVTIASVWYIYNNRQVRSLTEKPSKKNKHIEDQTSISVEHQGLSLVLIPKQIYSLKASGNYVEIGCENSHYLKRTTLRELLKKLPEGSFLQIHRSHAINLNKLVKLTNLANGNALATLSNQQKIVVSKKYKANVKSISIISAA
ncbi:LytR/AlgR family response regulator transcription factor [Arenicella xantha]|uniref:LytTr DNA-binding domain-containing protein n=1 Tax=Arenicella xantha TaxID=644221 RepID=A0A395JGY7_9GAMM|nr:LytTR family DNA-binding domain-containing protein [Arenicella xantha]RBP48705.1 LytTr DNA-binding domain-containing protein [Arenicella xantha]